MAYLFLRSMSLAEGYILLSERVNQVHQSEELSWRLQSLLSAIEVCVNKYLSFLILVSMKVISDLPQNASKTSSLPNNLWPLVQAIQSLEYCTQVEELLKRA